MKSISPGYAASLALLAEEKEAKQLIFGSVLLSLASGQQAWANVRTIDGRLLCVRIATEASIIEVNATGGEWWGGTPFGSPNDSTK